MDDIARYINKHKKRLLRKRGENMNQRFTFTPENLSFIGTVLLHAIVGAILVTLISLLGHYNFGQYQVEAGAVGTILSAVATQFVSK